MTDSEVNEVLPTQDHTAGLSKVLTSENIGDPADPATNSATGFNVVSTTLCCSSVFTFIQNELPALYAHLSDEDIAAVKTFITATLKPYDPKSSSALSHLVFRNTLSVAAKLLQHVLVSAISNPNYSNLQRQQLAGELERVRKSKAIDALVQEWVVKRRSKGVIGVLDGKPVFGPCLPGDEEDEDDVPLTPTFYVGMGGLEAMNRAAGRGR